MSLPESSIELPESPPKLVTEQSLEWAELKPGIERLLDYWKSRLVDAPTLELPTDRPRPAVQSFHKEIQKFSLPLDLTEELKALSQREGVTLFMTLMAAFQVLLHRYSGQDDIVTGTPITERSHIEIEGLNGFFVNTLVLRTDLSGNPSFCELLAQVREVTVGAYANQYMPFEKLVEVLHLQHDLSRNPLCQVMFMLQSISDDKQQLNEITPEFLKGDTGTSKFDLTLKLSETPHGLAGVAEYATDLFEAATIDRLIGHFQTLLEGVVAHVEERLSELPLLTEVERQQLLVEWNNTAASFPQDKCIHELIEAQVAATPQAVAVIYENSQLTYAELNTKANRLAHQLIALGVRPDDRVAIYVERSFEMVIGLLGIIKAGGAYVPLDPSYPEERLAYMLDDCAPVVVLTQQCLQEQLPNREQIKVPIIMLDTLNDLDSEAGFESKSDINNAKTDIEFNPAPIALGLTSQHLAYVIYTSGSTGQPKGVMNQHQGLVNRLWWAQNEYCLNSDDRILQKTPFSFDVSVWEFFLPLLAGAQLVVAKPQGHKDPHYLAQLVKQAQITTLHFVPSMLQIFLDQADLQQCTSLVRVLCSGEALPYALQMRFHALLPNIELHNLYGPTEAAIDVTSWLCSPDHNLGIVPIGYPIANTQIYILNTHLQPVPLGVTGELYIGGAGVARGYLNRQELTAERFVTDPFSAKADVRMYKTGDLARWLPNGSIEYLGRNDFQVKIRGFRIEIGEIETMLRQHPQLREVAVAVYEPVPNDKRLAAYIVPQSDSVPTASELRDFLKPKLPEFMVPSAFVFLDAMPLSPNGKLDRKALSVPDLSRQILNDRFIAPCSPVEKLLAEIWCEVLRINRIGIHDNFFELGGHSLLATQVIARVVEQLSVDIPLSALFEAPTIAELAKLIENTEARMPNHSKPIIPQRRSAYKNVGL